MSSCRIVYSNWPVLDRVLRPAEDRMKAERKDEGSKKGLSLKSIALFCMVGGVGFEPTTSTV